MLQLRRIVGRLPGGIALRISLLSWLVTLLTLTIFVTAIIPEQKKDLQEALRSKAQGISSSLQEVTAGAAVSEDYSSVVDQCVNALAGDQAIDYLVITKNDGFSVIVERSAWRTSTLDLSWRPGVRSISSGIQVVPLFQRRVFHFSRPFDYSAIQWGWIHVGLSLSSYDRSVARVYQRTGMLAVLCVGLSLIASVVYAKHLVKPILELQSVVKRVAHGDLTARATVAHSDEIGSLAGSLNTMADSILQRNRILESLRFAAQRFLTVAEWRLVVPEMLQRLGTAVGSSRGAVFTVHRSPDAPLRTAAEYLWQAQNLNGTGSQLQSDGIEISEHVEQLGRGDIVHYRPREECGAAAPSDRPVCILVPIHVSGEWFGFLAFDDPGGRLEWNEAELDALRTAAGMLDATITRQRAQAALLEAKEFLEQRVVERTRELQSQVNAKEEARAELAEAQQRLMTLSRAAGMAEVATGVLHNVGNVLNSVNVSTNLVESRTQELRIDHMVAAIEMLAQHRSDLPTFLDSTPAGQRVLPYLEKLGAHFTKERAAVLQEVRLLRDHVGHIKEIVATQQTYAKVSGLIDDISLAELVDDSLRIVDVGFTRHHIRVERSYEDIPPVPTDKHQILQILLNLLQNAKQAIKQAGPADRVVHVRIRRKNEDWVRIEVQDSGIGLPPEHLTRIFAHGFTTKKDGHGFGLHSGALAAKQVGGALWAESDGPGRGATFKLELPLASSRARQRGTA